MAKAGERIDSPDGQSLIFRTTSRDSDGQLLEMEAISHTKSKRPLYHYHPIQAERFEVLEGEVWTRIDGHEHVYAAGESFDVSPRARHQMTNASTEVASRMLWRVTPALRTETLFETFFGLARDGKMNGVPGLLHGALLLREYRDELRLNSPPSFVQVPLFVLLAPLARALGYRTWYPEYSPSERP